MDVTAATTGQIFAIKRYAIHDGPGIRTTVFLKGCPLNCWWCHNPESRHSPASDEAAASQITADDVINEVCKDVVFYDQSGGGVTFSGGEPLIQVDFLQAMLQTTRDHHIPSAVDTCGYTKYHAFKKILHLVDLFLFDLKIFDNDEHTQHVGVSNQLILDNLKALVQDGQHIRIRIPLIPGVTDSESNLTQIARYVATLDSIQAIDLLPYNQLGAHKYHKLGIRNERTGLQTQTPDELRHMRDLVAAHGFTVNIGGGA
jgi:pyruvate formate lyase activating enzyme